MTRVTLNKVNYTNYVMIMNNTECTELTQPTFKYKHANKTQIKQTRLNNYNNPLK
jgi:hypothetical protein